MRNSLIFAILSTCATITYVQAQVPTGVSFQPETIRRLGGQGDNWCQTWASDNSVITSMDDGDWLFAGRAVHNRLYRLTGGAADFSRSHVDNYPIYDHAGNGGSGSWFGYGVLAVGDTLYSAVSKTPGDYWSGPFNGVKLLKSPDNGQNWYRVNKDGAERHLSGPYDPIRGSTDPNEMFFWKEFGRPHNNQQAYPFSFLTFVQNGRGNSAAKDSYVYIYSPEGARSNQLLLARVHKDLVGKRSEWEYFVRYNGDQAVWSSDINSRQAVQTYPEKNADGNYFGWYSWLPSVVWNEGLGLYIMTNGGTYANTGMTSSDGDYYANWMHQRTGSLGFWYSQNPYGPWTQFYYTDYWTADSGENLTYQPKLSPKWISSDGRQMVLIWSDAQRNAAGETHSVHYVWNQMTINIQTSGGSVGGGSPPPPEVFPPQAPGNIQLQLH